MPTILPSNSNAPGASTAQDQWKQIAQGAVARGFSSQDTLALKDAYSKGGLVGASQYAKSVTNKPTPSAPASILPSSSNAP